MNSGIGRLRADEDRIVSGTRTRTSAGTDEPLGPSVLDARDRVQAAPGVASATVGWATRLGRAPTGVQFNVPAPSGNAVQAVFEDLGCRRFRFVLGVLDLVGVLGA